MTFQTVSKKVNIVRTKNVRTPNRSVLVCIIMSYEESQINEK